MIAAAQVMARLRHWLGRDVSPVVFFDASTIEALARYIDEDTPAALSLEYLIDEVEGLSDAEVRRLLANDRL